MTSSEKLIYHFTFLRHGESVGNAQSRWQGQSDYPLTERGFAQAQALAERWKLEDIKFDLAITSPLMRAQETARIITTMLNVKTITDPVWLERDIGEMEGLTVEEVRQRPQPPYVTRVDSIGGDGEGDWNSSCARAGALQTLLRRPVGSYLIVSHGGLLNQLMHAIVGVAHYADPSGVRFHFANASFAQVIYYPQGHSWAIETLNDRAHLESLK